MNLISLNNISKTYDGTNFILKDISLEIDQGEIIVVRGKSGTGKSTLMNIIGLIDKPTSGEYKFQGKLIEAKKDYSSLRGSKISFIFQSYHLIESNTVFDNILMPILYNNVKYDSDIENYAKELMEKLGILSLKDKKAALLSGGEKQRVAIARSLILKPSIVLADEPTGNLDSENTDIISEQFNSISNEGTSFLVVTHSGDFLRNAKRSYLMHDGILEREI